MRAPTFALLLVALGCRAQEASAPEPLAQPAPPAKPVAPVAQSPVEPEAPRQEGISVRYYFIGEPLEEIPLLVAGQTPNVSQILPRLELVADAEHKVGEMQYTFLTVCDGWLVVDTPGKHTLRLRSDDGSRLKLDGHVVIDHDGLHGPTNRDVELELAAGQHALEIQHFNTYGGWELVLSWKPPGAQGFEVVPAASLRCPRGEVRVTAPGKKKILRRLVKGSPGDGMPLEAVHPAYDLTTVRPEGFEPKVGGIGWLPSGEMVISTWDSEGNVWILSGTAGDQREKIQARKFASGLAEPLGLAVVDGRIFVLQKQELTELVDEDGDGLADLYRCVSSGWNVSSNFHEFAFGLVHKQGWLYANLAIAIDPGGKSTRPQVPGRGETIRISIADGHWETVAHGLRTPNGIGLGPNEEIFVTDNQGDWLPSSKLLHLESGAFYNSRAVLLEQAAALTVTPPVLWLPQNEIGNSPSTPALIPPGHGPYSGQMVHGDVTHGGVKRDFLELVEGVWQGAVLRWTQGLESGVNRLAFGPDGALYVGGIGSTGNWGQEGKRRYGLQRLKYNGKSAFEILALRARSNGFEVELTEPLAEGCGWESENWLVEQWRYVPTEQYGGPKVDEKRLKVLSASVAPDRKRVFLELEGLAEGHVVHLHVVGPVRDAQGRRLWSTEAWYTLNRIPRALPGSVAATRPVVAHNVLSDAERRAGWKLLFDGRTPLWRAFKGTALPAGWTVEDGALVQSGGGGDLVTLEEYGDFELSLEWQIAAGGNSGVFFHVDERHDYVWQSGPEMQVLDNDAHADGANPLTSAGSNYALHAPPRDVTLPVGMWNRARLLVRGGHVEHWLNDEKIVEYELWSPEWVAGVAASKFAGMPDYGQNRRGRLALQDHGDRVAFRNLKIRELAPR